MADCLRGRSADFAAPLRIREGCCRGFLKRILNDATVFLMQGEEDAARLLALGAPKNRVVVTGNLKYDLREPPGDARSRCGWKRNCAKGKRVPC